MTAPSSIAARFQEHGVVHVPGFFAPQELAPLREVVLRFHTAWIAANEAFYRNRAVNSAYLTSPRYLSAEDRLVLFQFLAQARVADVLAQVFRSPPAFMNTQLFFNPVDPTQPNYWHRDIQYTGMSLEDQQQALGKLNVVHLRVPLRPEPGLEVIPGTHQRWDTPSELSVRLEQPGHRNCDPLADALTVPLQPGDLLVFSANMIHRGLYGMDRLAFDMLFCDPVPSLLAHVQQDCLPEDSVLEALSSPDIFLRARTTRGTAS